MKTRIEIIKGKPAQTRKRVTEQGCGQQRFLFLFQIFWYHFHPSKPHSTYHQTLNKLIDYCDLNSIKIGQILYKMGQLFFIHLSMQKLVIPIQIDILII